PACVCCAFHAPGDRRALRSFPTRRSSDLGSHAGDELGWSLAGTGDLDDDGVPDLIVGARYGDAVHDFDVGLARVVSGKTGVTIRSEEHTSELQSRENLVCRLLLEKKKNTR